MADLRDGLPYTWVTWLAKILAGDSSCEWAAWFRARHDPNSWQRVSKPSLDAWHIRHAALLSQIQDEWRQRKFSLWLEGQNYFKLRGSCEVLAGKPDMIAVRDRIGVVVDAKTGRPSPAHIAQVMLYMYAVPRALPLHRDITFDGLIVYEDHEVYIPAVDVDDAFIDRAVSLIRRLSADEPPSKAPSASECRSATSPRPDCPERVSQAPSEVTTGDFQTDRVSVGGSGRVQKLTTNPGVNIPVSLSGFGHLGLDPLARMCVNTG